MHDHDASPMQQSFRHDSEMLIVRTPLLPFSTLRTLGPRDGDDVETAATQVRRRMAELLKDPTVFEALRIASPSLASRLPEWRPEESSRRNGKLEHSLYRYLSRMASRSTPFGLLAGITLGAPGIRTSCQIAATAEWRRVARLSAEHARKLARRLQEQPGVVASCRWRPNDSLARLGHQYRYVEVRYAGDEGEALFELSALEADDTLEWLLGIARTGLTLEELSRAMHERMPTVPATEVQGYLQQLLTSQVLVSDLAPPLTTDDALGHVERCVARAGLLGDAAALARLRGAVRSIGSPIGTDVSEHYAEVGLSLGLDADESIKALQIDLIKPGTVTVSNSLLSEVVDAVGAVARCVATPCAALERFKTLFVERFEDAEVPLALALDPESGIGFAANVSGGTPSVLKGLNLSPAATAGLPPLQCSTWDMLMLRAVVAALSRGESEARLNRQDVDALAAASTAKLPARATMAFKLLHDDPKSDRPVAAVLGIVGMGGECLASRFAHASPILQSWLQRSRDAEQTAAGDAILAEVIYTPTDRAANVVTRPVLSAYEIPYLCSPGVDAERCLAIDDLLVRVVDGRVRLRSRRHGREVIPRLTTAHNFEATQLAPVYRFLGHLQREGESLLTLSGSQLLSALPYVPRIVLDRVVLRLAQWTIPAADMAPLRTGSGPTRMERMATLRRTRGLPRWVLSGRGDNVMAFDLANPLSVAILVDEVPAGMDCTLTECIEGENESPVVGPAGAYAHEIAVPLHATTPAAAASNSTRQEPAMHEAAAMPSPAIAHVPGSEWTYAKIYCGEAVADSLLTGRIAPLMRNWQSAGLVDRWFFIRYSDPQFHLRLRMHRPPESRRTDLMADLTPMLERELASGLISRIQLDTFRPEVHRYGGPSAYGLAYEMQGHDSDAVLALLAVTADHPNADQLRWNAGVLGVHRLLDDAGYELHERISWASRMGDGQHRRFGAGRSLAVQLGERFRQRRAEIESILSEDASAHDQTTRHIAGIFAARSAAWSPALQQLRIHAAGERLPDIIGSLSHMFINRLMRSAPNAQELLVYDTLARLYTSSKARLAGQPSR